MRTGTGAMQGRKIVSGLALLAILAMSAWIQFTVVARTTAAFPMVSDAANYFSYAYNLKHDGVYSNTLTWGPEPPPGGMVADALSPPGYPLFLRAIPGLAPDGAWLQRVNRVQAALGVGSVLLVFLLAGTFLRPGWTHLAAAITAINPHLATISTNLLTEALFLFLLLASTLATVHAMRAGRRGALFVVAGLLWGVCSLVRPTTLFVAPLLLLAAWLVPALATRRRGALLLVLAFALVQLPWLVRNQVTPLDDQGSLMVATLHHGAYPGFMYQDRPETLGWPFRYDPDSEQAERDLPSVVADIARKFRAAPLRMATWYLVGKPGAFLSWGYVQGRDVFVFEPSASPYLDDGRFLALRALALALHWPLMLLGVLVAALAFWRPRWLGLEGEALLAARLVAALVLYAIAFHMVAAPYPRYGVPFRPLLYVLAVAGVAAMVGRWRGRRAVDR